MYEKAKTMISTNSHGKKLQITSFFSQSQTFHVCSYDKNLFFLFFARDNCPLSPSLEVLLLGRYFELRENAGTFLFHRNRGFADLSYSISIGNGIKE